MIEPEADNVGGKEKTAVSTSPSGTSPTTRLLRRVALVGTGMVLLWKATSLSQMRPNQGWGFVVLFLACVAVGLTCLMVLPGATRRLRRNPDLLVPLGLYLTAEALWTLLLAIPIISGVFPRAWNPGNFCVAAFARMRAFPAFPHSGEGGYLPETTATHMSGRSQSTSSWTTPGSCIQPSCLH